MPLDFIFERFEEKEDGKRTEIEFICSFEGPIPSRDEVLGNLSLCFGFEPGCATMERFRPVGGKKRIKGRIIVRR